RGHAASPTNDRSTSASANRGVRAIRSWPQPWVRPRRDEPRVARQLDDLHQAPVGRYTAEHHPGLAERFAVLVVELEAVTVALVNDLFAISLVRERPRDELAWIQTQAHRRAHLVDVSLLG